MTYSECLSAAICFGIIGPFLTILGIKMLNPINVKKEKYKKFIDGGVIGSLGDPYTEKARKHFVYHVLTLGAVFDLIAIYSVIRIIVISYLVER